MTISSDPTLAPAAERLATLANLLELALHAPEGELTFNGRAALQIVAREVVLLSHQVQTGAKTPATENG